MVKNRSFVYGETVVECHHCRICKGYLVREEQS